MKRIVIAAGIAALIYGIALGAGSLLYATGAIATGATHNDCANFKETLAPQYGNDEEKVPQSAIKALAKQCLAGHELTEKDAFRSAYPELSKEQFALRLDALDAILARLAKQTDEKCGQPRKSQNPQ